ncbi:hypothetical protein H7J86_05545 [Mycobacterium hackensackense]|uniref:hypothetical protein n=1 Tax=Mycobacterium hackensackense TaxID=228909 RepID=UPI0022659848|nr:hypothetical protein [Mycobacterium hackensackense]MCV7251620.1 hypothetical protein [Mycobacterium hackensackense]
MYTAAHVGISAIAPTAIVLAASGELPSGSLVAVSVATALAVDALDHAVYQIRFSRSSPRLRAAWSSLLKANFRTAISRFKEIEDSREINRLIIHSRGGLVTVTIIGIILTLYFNSAVVAAGSMSAILALHCDVLWDWRCVGHANNWFGRPTMRYSGSLRFAGIQIRWFWLWWPIMHFLGLFPACWLYLLESVASKQKVVTYLLVFVPLSIIVACFLGVISIMLAINAQSNLRAQSLKIFSESPRRYVQTAPTSVLFYTKKARIAGYYNWIIVNHISALLITACAIAASMTASVALLPPKLASFQIPFVGVEALNVAMVFSVLLISLACGYLVHSTAGFLGGCLGAGLGTIILIALPPTRNIVYENHTVLTAAMLAALVSWVGGLIFLRIPGTVRTSATVLTVTPAKTDFIPELVSMLNSFLREELANSVSKIGTAAVGPPVIAQPRLRYSVTSQSGALSISRKGETHEMAIKYEPRRVQLSVLYPTFYSKVPGWKSGLLPKANAANDLSEKHYVSEVLDNILTNSAYIVAQLYLYEVGPEIKVVCRCFEQTTTKQYATTYSRSIVQSVALRLDGSSLVTHISNRDVESPGCPYPAKENQSLSPCVSDPALADLPTIAAEARELGTVRRHAGRRLGLTLVAQVATVATAVLRVSEFLRR